MTLPLAAPIRSVGASSVGSRARPWLVLLVGLPGTGKSHFARQLSVMTGAVVISSDELRRRLFPERNYLPAENRAVYARAHRDLARTLAGGRSVIFDATNLAERSRHSVRSLAAHSGAEFAIVHFDPPFAVVKERLARRAAALDPLDLSEADVSVFQALRSTFEPVRGPHCRVVTSADEVDVLSHLAANILCPDDGRSLAPQAGSGTVCQELSAGYQFGPTPVR